MPEARKDRINFRPLRLLTTLRVAVAALLVAFAVILFLSFGRREEEPVRIELSPPTGAGEEIVDHSDNFVITGTKAGRDSFRMRAERLTGFVGDKKILQDVHLEVFGEEETKLTLTGTDGQFDLAQKRAQISGDVLVQDKNGFKLRTGSLYYDGDRDMIFTPNEISFESEGLEGTGRGLHYLTQSEVLKIPAEVKVTIRPRNPGEMPATLTSGDLTLGLESNEVIFHDSVIMRRGDETVTANYLKAVFDEDRRNLLSVEAYGQVTAVFPPGREREGEAAHLMADSLRATFSSEGSGLERVEALGHCRLTRGDVTATSERLEAEDPLRRIALRGGPMVVDARSRISAQEIDLIPEENGLEARSDVKTSLLSKQGEDATATPTFFSGTETVYFQSARLVVEDDGKVARYSGGARGWQGADSIQAMEIVFHLTDRRMRAFRNVLCRFGEADAQPTDAIDQATTVIVADAMDYDESEGTVHYRSGVKLTRRDATLMADRMDVELSDPSAGRRRIEKVQAEGSARFTHQDSTGKADRLIYTPSTNLAEMQQDAGLAEVVDRVNGRTLRGKILTFDLAANRVLTENAVGGRSWIKLNPNEEDGRALDSKTGN